MDAGLVQLATLDGWDNTTSTSREMREEYRKFLVDSHRAAYVPICLAGANASGLTYEPAVVVPHPNDMLQPVPLDNPIATGNKSETLRMGIFHASDTLFPSLRIQRGASLSRMFNDQSFRRRKVSSTSSKQE